MPIGTLVNVAAVILGGLLGLLLRKGLPERFKEIIFQGIGLFTIVLGMINALRIENPANMMAVIFSLLVGGLIGEWINIEKGLLSLGDKVKTLVKGQNQHFSEGMVTAFLIFCIGPLTIIGALGEGINGDPSLLYTKSILDGFMAIALTSTFGVGVTFSAIPLFIFQYGITLIGMFAGRVLDDGVINQLTAVGGILILGLGINILGIKQLRIANLLPALIFILLFTKLFDWIL